MIERRFHSSQLHAIGRDAIELQAEYTACTDEHERRVILLQLRQLEGDRKRLQERAETLARLPEVWGAIYGEVRGYLGLFSAVRRDRRLTDPHSMYFDWPRQVEPAVRWVEREAAAQRELYHCAHLLTERRRRKEFAAPLAAVYVDLDTAPRITTQLPPPSVVVQSSPGRFQHYWSLTEPLAPAMGETLNRHLATLLDADASGWDLTQLLRVPGTLNYKYQERPTVQLLNVRPTRYAAAALRDLDAEFPLFQPTTPLVEPEPAAADDLPPPLEALTDRLSRRARAIVLGQVARPRADGTTDRSASLVQIARVLHGAGLSGGALAHALAERDTSLGWHKYSTREDAWKQYKRIVALVESDKGT